MKSHRWIAASFLAVAPIALAQQQPSGVSPAETSSVTGVELKGKAPVNPLTLRVELPRPQEARLENGLEAALIEDHELPTFALQLIVKGGGLADPPDKRGLAMAAAALLREGTGRRSSREIAEAFARLGSSFNATASPSSGETSVVVSGLAENFEETLALAAELLREPTFPQSEIDKFKARFLAQLQHQRSLPGFLAQEQFMRAVYGEHPGGLIVPPENVVRTLKSEDLAAYHRAHYQPTNIILIAHGALRMPALMNALKRVFGDWPEGEAASRKAPEPAPPVKPRVLLVDRPGSVQTALWLGSLGIERNSEDYFAMLVMNHILGGGPASRLFLNLREDKGYTYGVFSTFTGSSFPGVVAASTDVRSAVTAEALRELEAEVKRIGAEPVPPQELANAKRALVGRFALSLDSPQALISNLATQKIYDLPEDYWDDYPQHVQAVSAADIQRVARKYYDPKRLQLVAVGDGGVIRKALEKYGDVETITSAAP